MTGEAKRDPLDALYEAELDSFMALRAELVADAKAKKDKALVDALKAARKPTSIAWAMNQVVRKHRADVEALFETGDALRETQAAMLAGRGADAMRDAKTAERDAIVRLRRLAQEILAARGHDATTDQLRRIEQTFRSAATGSEEMREAVLRGRMAADLSPDDDAAMASFEALAASLPVAPAAKALPAAVARASEVTAQTKAAREDASPTTAAGDDGARRREREAEEREREAREREAREAAELAREEEIVVAAAASKDAKARAHDAERAAHDAEKEATAVEREAQNARARATAARGAADEAAKEAADAAAHVELLQRRWTLGARRV